VELTLASAPSLINLVAVIAAITALIGVAITRKRRADALAGKVDDEDAYSGPEPTQAEIEEAERSIREKTTRAVKQAKRKLICGLLTLVLAAGISVPFMAGMPLHRYFRPWGQLAILTCGAAFFFSVIACTGMVTTWQYKRDLTKWLDSLREPE
jgi:hypothetical protein